MNNFSPGFPGTSSSKVYNFQVFFSGIWEKFVFPRFLGIWGFPGTVAALML